VNSILAKREAQRLGYDEGIMLDASGRVAEATAENIFMLYRGRLYTPPLDSPILGGITRDTVIVLAREAGLEVIEQSFTRDMLYAASEVLLTGTGAEVTPVREIDGRPIGTGKPGPVTQKLQAAFYKTVRGPGEPRPDWLQYI
jgi:branched-chain amino acid aminotransferase